jgi:signal transduction histidine kinase
MDYKNRMKQKIAFLIAGCIVTVVALTAVQGYFIRNTYLLYAKEANAAITQHLLTLETGGKLDSINNAWMRKTDKFIVQYHRKNVTKNDYKKLIAKTCDSLSGIMSAHVQKQKVFEEYDVAYTNYIRMAVLYSKGNTTIDTLFKGKMKLFSNNTLNIPETQASESTWKSKSEDEDYHVDYDFVIVTERYYSIENWQRQVLIKMSGLLIFSVLLLVFVVLLFYWSIKGLIAQKKIADIKTDFINNITHEFQTPLAALDIAVNTLQKKEAELTAEHYSNTLAIIDRQNKRMQKLFRQVAEASLAAEVINTAEAQDLGSNDIQQIVNDFSLLHPETMTVFGVSDKNISIHIDRSHLATILVNLMDNAVKYGASSIIMKLEKQGNNVILTVTDNGPGIAPKEQKAIFDKFYRVQKGNIHTTKGLGLGLYYVHELVTAYNGTITVNSEPGQGATFIISIPQA